ncbi:MAG TPA: hypothetical protein PLJ73_09135 [Myxococcota bacterium]|nr:hypothetical protein [Myxococcota bacterium]
MLSLVRSNWIFRWGLAALLVLFVSACGDEAVDTDNGGNKGDMMQDQIDPEDTAQDTSADRPDTDEPSEPDNGETPEPDNGETPEPDNGETPEPDNGETPEQDHPHWDGAAWETFIPGEDETALYHIVPYGPDEFDLTARLFHNVEWKGGTWSQIVVGDLEPGKDGMAIYVDLSEPWVARAKGVEVYSSDYEAGVGQVEYFTEPIVLPLDQAAGESTKVDTTMIGKFRDHEEGEGVGVSYTIKVESYDYVYEAPWGDLPGCVKIVVTLSGDFAGGNEIPVEVIAHPTQRIVFWESTPAFVSVAIKEAWKK